MFFPCHASYDNQNLSLQRTIKLFHVITIPEHIFVLASKSYSFNHWVCRQAKNHGAFYVIIQQATQFLQHQIYIT